jgi:hypothetical protein
MIAARTTRATNEGTIMVITMDTRMLPRAKHTTIGGRTDMTIIRQAYTMVAMLATMLDIALEERGTITTVAITTRAPLASEEECPTLRKKAATI